VANELGRYLNNVRAGWVDRKWVMHGSVFDDSGVFVGIANAYSDDLIACAAGLVAEAKRMRAEDADKFPRP